MRAVGKDIQKLRTGFGNGMLLRGLGEADS